MRYLQRNQRLQTLEELETSPALWAGGLSQRLALLWDCSLPAQEGVMFSSPMYAAGSSPIRGATLAFGALPFTFVAGALQGPGLEKYPGVRLYDLLHT